MKAWSFILLPSLLLSQLVPLSGWQEGKGPFLGILTDFHVDMEHVESQAVFLMEFSIYGGDLYFNAQKGSPLVFLKLEYGDVALYGGYLKPRFPQVWDPGVDSWVLRLGSSWIVFGDEVEIISDIGPVRVWLGENRRIAAVILGNEDFGIGVMISPSWKLVVKIFGISFILGDGLEVYSYRDDMTISYKNEMTFFLVGESGYIKFDEGVEFLERVGSVYAFGRFSEQEKRFGIGFRF